MDELDPCPFCGCELIEVQEAGAPDEGYQAECTLCYGAGPLAETVSAAAELWNDRDGC